MPLVVIQQCCAQRAYGRPLQPTVHGCDHFIAGRVGIGAESIEQIGAYHLSDVRGLDLDGGAMKLRFDGCVVRCLLLLRSDIALLTHATQDVAAAMLCELCVRDGIVAGGKPERAGDQRNLRQRKLIDRLAEVHLGGCAHAVSALSKKHFVHVQRENFLLRKLLFDTQREKDLLQFASITFLGAQEDAASQLHGDRAAALAFLSRHQMTHGCACQTWIVDASVLEEAVVLGCEQRLNQRLG